MPPRIHTLQYTEVVMAVKKSSEFSFVRMQIGRLCSEEILTYKFFFLDNYHLKNLYFVCSNFFRFRVI